MLEKLNHIIGEEESLNILEVGPGKKPLINEIPKRNHQLFAIDKEVNSHQFSEISWNLNNLCDYKPDKQFDIIIDSLCWHEQESDQWILFISHLNKILKKGGTIIGEHAVSHSSMIFHQENLMYIDETFELLEQKNENIKVVKYIPPPWKIEQCFLKLNLKINRFYINPSKKIICNRADKQIYPTDPDVLEYQVIK